MNSMIPKPSAQEPPQEKTILKYTYQKWQMDDYWNYMPFSHTLIGKILEVTIRYLVLAFFYLGKQVVSTLHYLVNNFLKITFRLVFIGIALLIITEKEIQFSMNMVNPIQTIFHGQAIPPLAQVTKKVALIEPEPIQQANHQASKTSIKSYIKRFAKVATIEMEKYGIPASLKLGLAILESQYGHHDWVEAHNQHFNYQLPAKTYSSDWENWRAHSELLKKEYAQLFVLGNNTDKWIEALLSSNYLKTNDQARMLQSIIEDYHLYLLDEY